MSDSVIVHIVDDEPSVRKSLGFLVSAAGYAVRVHESAASFLASRPYPPGNCLVTDLRMPDIDGVALLRRLKEAGELIPAIVVTGHGDVQLAVTAMKVGAIDFIEKPFEDTVLLEAIGRAVGQARDDIDHHREHDVIADRLASLTERERQVFDGVVAGKANKTIAYERGLSPRTVEVYRANVMSKLHAKTLSELVRMALSAGLEIQDQSKN
jgi:two-component system response regulator FixJ